MMGSMKAKIVSDEVAVKRMDALSGSESERSGGNAFIGAWAPGSNGDRPSDAIEGGSELLTFEKEEADAKVGAVDTSKEVGKTLKVRFNGHEDIERVLGSTEILSEGEAERV